MSTEVETAEGPAVILTYDYEQLSPDVRNAMMHRACRIKLAAAVAVEGVIEVGRLLAEGKEDLDEDVWLEWASTEFGMGKTSAYRYMNVSSRIGPVVSGLEPAQKAGLTLDAAYELARKVAAPIRAEAVRLLIMGQRVTHKMVLEMIGMPPPAELPKKAKRKKKPAPQELDLHLNSIMGSFEPLAEVDPAEVAAVVHPILHERYRDQLRVIAGWLEACADKLEEAGNAQQEAA